MLQLRTSVAFWTLLVLLFCQVWAEDCELDDDNDDAKSTTVKAAETISDGLCDDFQELRSTIPEDTLNEILRSRFGCDSRFRRAMRFYETPRFQQLTLQLQQSTAYKTLLQSLHNASVDTTDIDNVADIFYCLVVPVPEQPSSPNRNRSCSVSRRQSFISQILEAMSRKDVHAYIAEAQAQNTNFGKFSKAVMSPRFRADLQGCLAQREIARPLRTLRRNGWDIPYLLRAAMAILVW